MLQGTRYYFFSSLLTDNEILLTMRINIDLFTIMEMSTTNISLNQRTIHSKYKDRKNKLKKQLEHLLCVKSGNVYNHFFNLMCIIFTSFYCWSQDRIGECVCVWWGGGGGICALFVFSFFFWEKKNSHQRVHVRYFENLLGKSV